MTTTTIITTTTTTTSTAPVRFSSECQQQRATIRTNQVSATNICPLRNLHILHTHPRRAQLEKRQCFEWYQCFSCLRISQKEVVVFSDSQCFPHLWSLEKRQCCCCCCCCCCFCLASTCATPQQTHGRQIQQQGQVLTS